MTSPPPSLTARFPPQVMFRQFINENSYSYILAHVPTRKALIIDASLQSVDRDAAFLRELGLELIYIVESEQHSDHVTGAGELKLKHFPSAQTVRGKTGNFGATADVKIETGKSLRLGEIDLEFWHCPGHTQSSFVFVYRDACVAFTGSSVLARSVSRCDFQGGNARSMYESIHRWVLTLPEDFILFPGQDANGRTCTSVFEEARFNPYFCLGEIEFIKAVEKLSMLPTPSSHIIAANRVLGLEGLVNESIEYEKRDALGNELKDEEDLERKREAAKRKRDELETAGVNS